MEITSSLTAQIILEFENYAATEKHSYTFKRRRVKGSIFLTARKIAVLKIALCDIENTFKKPPSESESKT